MRALWIDLDNHVVNIVEYADEIPTEDSGYRVIAAAGSESVGDIVMVPKVFVPVTRRQMFTALHRAGMLEGIKAAVAANPDVELQIAWEEADTFHRDNAMLVGMAAVLGISDAQIDMVFDLAASVQ